MTSAQPPKHRAWLDVLILSVIVAAIYLSRLTALPMCGEEPRWGRGAVQMLETGDWVVLRQQGMVFPERPPMSSWAMAVAGLVRGKVDDIAIRLPSVLAVLFTTWLIYYYVRAAASRFAAFTGGLAYATMGQVLQLGRMGESEALFTFFVAASLMVWHRGYICRWRPILMWTTGYALAALGALVKGPQAPVYFIAVTTAYLALQRDWRCWLSGAQAAGVAVFLVVVGAWQIPYYLATDMESVWATWAGLATDRMRWSGLWEHIASYPLETFVCLLPWSPLLIVLLKPSFHRGLEGAQPLVVFVLTAVAVTYPTVWFVSMARGRYFMPLYPCIAAVIGVILDRCISAGANSSLHGDWRRFARGAAAAAVVAAIGVAAVFFIPIPKLANLRQPLWLIGMLAMSASLCGVLLWRESRRLDKPRAQVALVAFGCFLGLFYSGAVVNSQMASWNNPRETISQVKRQLSPSTDLISFGPVDHRFAYFYDGFIPQHPWPQSRDETLPDFTYFCFNRYPGDTHRRKMNGRGRSWTTTSGTLPFAWEEVAEVCCERRLKPNVAQRTVVIGRIIR